MAKDIAKKVYKNIVFGFGGQVLILIISIVLPRLILVSYGSDTNGLTSAITQVFSYLALLEAGIGNASINLLYKNIAANDRDAINDTISATQCYFHKILPVYVFCVGIFAAVYPEIVHTDVSHTTIRMIILIQGLGAIVNFAFSNTYTQLLIADGRNYVVSNLNLMVKFLAAVAQIVLINCGFDVVCIQYAYLLFYIIKAIVINFYIKKQYSWLDKKRKTSTGILSQRNAFVVHEISSVIFSSTDVFVLSMFCSMKVASVYAIYNLIFSSLNSFMGVFIKGIDFTLGHEYNRDREKYIKLHDAYECLYMCLVFAVLTTACVFTLPFVRLYTRGITDIDYVDKYLPPLFAMIQLLSCSRAISSKLITIADKAKDTIPQAVFEDIINLTVSIFLVSKIGIYGVLIGTIVALLYRTNDIIIYANRRILKRMPLKVYRNMFLDFSLFGIMCFIFSKINLPITSYIDFVLWGMLLFVMITSIFLVANLSIEKSLGKFVFRYIRMKH